MLLVAVSTATMVASFVIEPATARAAFPPPAASASPTPGRILVGTLAFDPFAWRPSSGVIAAMVGSAVVGAQFVAGQAARNALFLDRFEPRSLPPLIIATSVVSILLVVVGSRMLRRVAPSTYVPAAFAASAVLILAEWGLTFALPGLAAWIVYLQVSGLGPMLGSGFWLIASERFDPRTAKKHYGEIAGAGTLGGLAGGLVAARVARPPTSELAAARGCAASRVRLAAARRVASAGRMPGQPKRACGGQGPVRPPRPDRERLPAATGRPCPAGDALRQPHRLRLHGAGEGDLRGGPVPGSFFSLYYATISLVAFIVQMFGSRLVLERLGLGAAASAPDLAVAVGGAVSYVVPGLSSITLARAGEAICRKVAAPHRL